MNDEILKELIFPRKYKKLYNRLQLLFMRYGEEAIKDCEASCAEHNKNVVTCWNLFNAGVAAYNLGELKKAIAIFNHCEKTLQLIYKDVDIFDDSIIDLNGSYVGVVKEFNQYTDILNDDYKINDFEKGKVIKLHLTDDDKICIVTPITDLGVLDFSVEHPVERTVVMISDTPWYVYVSKNKYSDGVHYFKFVSGDYSNN